MELQEALVATATRLAKEIDANAILALTETGEPDELVFKSGFSKEFIERATGMKRKGIKVVAATPNDDTYNRLIERPDAKVIKLTARSPNRLAQIQHAVWRGIRDGVFWPGEQVVCLVGDAASPGATDTILIYRISETETTLAEIIESDPVLAAITEIACELGRVGYHGQPVGTAFIIGDDKKVLARSNQLGMNPFKGHALIDITKKDNWEIVKSYALLDGAFVLDEKGKLLAAGMYLKSNAKVEVPSGLGTRHVAVAAMTAVTKAKGITVSGTDGAVRIFENGKILVKIDPNTKIVTEVLMK